MKTIVTKILAILAFALIPLSLHAQSQTLSVSPIPDDVENRFCYYAGLAYSKQSYIIITGSNSVTSTSSEVQERLLECVESDDESLHWVGRSKISTGR